MKKANIVAETDGLITISRRDYGDYLNISVDDGIDESNLDLTYREVLGLIKVLNLWLDSYARVSITIEKES